MRQRTIAGNWKMHKTPDETRDFCRELMEKLPETPHRIILAPAFTGLYHACEAVRGPAVEIAAQNLHHEPEGAYTGEVSAAMIRNAGASHVIVGHSERREYFGEKNEFLFKKVQAALYGSLKVIFCVGEKLEHREAGDHFDIVAGQLENTLFRLDGKWWPRLIIAYEPVWAIGTGVAASPEQAQEMHGFIREAVAKSAGEETAQAVQVLYGGSVNPGNADALFSKPDIDGALVGGASLKIGDFLGIIRGQ